VQLTDGYITISSNPPFTHAQAHAIIMGLPEAIRPFVTVLSHQAPDGNLISGPTEFGDSNIVSRPPADPPPAPVQIEQFHAFQEQAVLGDIVNIALTVLQIGAVIAQTPILEPGVFPKEDVEALRPDPDQPRVTESPEIEIQYPNGIETIIFVPGYLPLGPNLRDPALSSEEIDKIKKVIQSRKGTGNVVVRTINYPDGSSETLIYQEIMEGEWLPIGRIRNGIFEELNRFA
jgi:hypothetical protein